MANKRLLILNWKDIKNPLSGGAEILTHELAKGLIKNGYTVTMFVSHFKGAKRQETIDGIRIIREGRIDIRFINDSVHYKAYKYYKKHLQGKVDIIIDEVHGIPFFAKFYAKEPVLALTCEVAGAIWFRMFHFPWSTLGWVTEQIYLKLYKKVPTMTISNSQKQELIKSGIPSKLITVLPMGFNRVNVQNISKEKNPTIIFVGRLNKMKGVEDAVKAIAAASKKIKKLQFWIVGRGEKEFTDNLKALIEKEGISELTEYFNYVSEKKKFELMMRAHAIIVPSVREGFGLIVPEAGSVGTPAIVYDTHGLRDTIRNGVNGIKVKQSPVALANGIKKIFSDKKVYRRMSQAAKRESTIYNWENTTKIALQVLQ